LPGRVTRKRGARGNRGLLLLLRRRMIRMVIRLQRRSRRKVKRSRVVDWLDPGRVRVVERDGGLDGGAPGEPKGRMVRWPSRRLRQIGRPSLPAHLPGSRHDRSLVSRVERRRRQRASGGRQDARNRGRLGIRTALGLLVRRRGGG
jgi:hypothetical protein